MRRGRRLVCVCACCPVLVLRLLGLPLVLDTNKCESKTRVRARVCACLQLGQGTSAAVDASMGCYCVGAFESFPRPCYTCAHPVAPGRVYSSLLLLSRSVPYKLHCPARPCAAEVPNLCALLQVAMVGMMDGAMRAHYKLPTILGESVIYEEASPLTAEHVSFARTHGTGRSLLMQQELGGPCSHPWNCQEGLVCRDDLCQTCHTNEECMAGNDKEQCFNVTARGGPVRVRCTLTKCSRIVAGQCWTGRGNRLLCSG